MPKLTQNFVGAKVIVPESGQVIYRDSALAGFGLRVTPGCKSYIVEARVNGVVRRVTLGKHGALTAASARKKAKRLLAIMAAGKDPVAEKNRKKIVCVTLYDVLEHYLSVRAVRPNTKRQYMYMIPRCLGDWLDLPVTSITKDMVEDRHRQLRRTTRQGTCGEAQANATMRLLEALLNFAAANYEIDGQPIITSNPVKRLTKNHLWYQEHTRLVIPNHKLPEWYQTVIGLRQPMVRDYLLLLLFTGLRRSEAATLRWSDIDFESRTLTIRSELSKNHKEHRLPLSDFIEEILRRRELDSGESEFVFPGRRKDRHMIDSDHVVRSLASKIQHNFTLHDLRRTFLTTAEGLSLSYVVLKKLANHSMTNDVTFGYLVVAVERLREPMQMITNKLLALMNTGDEQQSLK